VKITEKLITDLHENKNSILKGVKIFRFFLLFLIIMLLRMKGSIITHLHWDNGYGKEKKKKLQNNGGSL